MPCLSAPPALAQAAAVKDAPVEKETSVKNEERKPVFNAAMVTLENGMRVVAIPNHRAPVVTHMVWYGVGAADEPVGQSGIAHFLEHLMFKGTATMEPGAFSRTVRALGGNDNAFTGQDYTAYHQSISVDHLEKVMTMEAERMRGLRPPAAEIESERQVILEERRQRIENDPRAAMAEQMRYALFPNHPYGTPNIGWADEMAQLDWTAAQSMYDRFYAPNNAVLIVAGDITMAQLKPLAEKIYGVIPRGEVPERAWRTIPPLPGSYRVEMRHPTFRQPLWQRYYRVPSYRQNKQDSLALQVLQNILSGGAATRLYKKLVVEDKIATAVNMGYQPDAWADGTVSIGAIPAQGQDPATVERAIEDELRRVVRDGVTATELREAQERMRDEAAFARDSLTGPAMVIGVALMTGGTLEDVEYWPYDIGNVTAAQVQDVARRFLNPDDMAMRPTVTGLALPPLEEPQQAPEQTEDAE